MAKVRLSGGEDERALPKVGRKWGRLLVYKSRYGWIVRTVSDQVSPAQRRVISGWAGWLRWMNIIWKYLAPDLKLEFLRLEKISGVPARDLFMSSANGLLWYFELENGRRIYSMAHRERISRSLDVFSQVPGSMLVRGAEVWEELLPGPEGYVLSVLNGRPAWVAGGGGGGGVYFFPAAVLDGEWGWRGLGGEGVTLLRMADGVQHYVRCVVPVSPDATRVNVQFLIGSGLNPRGSMVFRVSVYQRLDALLELVGVSESVVDFSGSGYPARLIGVQVDLALDPGVRGLVVEVRRLGGDPRDNAGVDGYLYFVAVWF